MTPGRYGKALLTFAAMSLTIAASSKEYLVYFGTYTNALSKGIYVSRLDAVTGALSASELAVETPHPCFVCVSPDEKFLYAATGVSSFQGEKAGAISAFAIDQKTGRLVLLNEKSSGGAGPCHVSIDATGKILLAANYGGGGVKSFRLNTDGSLGADGNYVQHHGSSANASRQSAPHAHFICPDPSNHFALACDLGLDKVLIYKIDPATGTLSEHSSASVPPGAGARHLAFSPDGKFAYVANEMGCSVTVFTWDAAAGKLAPVETVCALPPGEKVQPAFTAAEILTSGAFVYVTLRGYDSVTVLQAGAQTGRLTFVQNLPAGGKIPRGLGIDPSGRWLIVGNQKTDNAVEYAIDRATGKLSSTGQELKIGSPVDVKFVASK